MFYLFPVYLLTNSLRITKNFHKSTREYEQLFHCKTIILCRESNPEGGVVDNQLPPDHNHIISFVENSLTSKSLALSSNW